MAPAAARQKTASTDSPSAVANRNATATDGTSRPISMALISVRETPLLSAKACCDHSRVARWRERVLVRDTIMARVRHDRVHAVNQERTAGARVTKECPMMQISDLVRLLAVFTCSGIFWMMIWFLLEEISMKHPLPGSTGLAIVVLVVSAYLLVDVVTHASVVLFLAPPR